MVDTVIREIITRLSRENLTQEQLRTIESTLYITLSKYEVSLKSTDLTLLQSEWKAPLDYFLARKRMRGESENTIKLYEFHLARLLATVNKKVQDITENDLILYLAAYKRSRNVSNVYLDNIRRCMSTFFGFLYKKGEITRNPAGGVEMIKSDKLIKKAYSDEELERIRRSCPTLRDMAMIEFLYTTGVRISEMVALNRDDVRIADKEVIVYGKGAKERQVYLTPVSSMYIREYLAQRDDDNPALFVSLRKPNKRLTKDGVALRIRQIGESAGVEKCHAHRFRRTTATNLLRRGMPIEEVQVILGHEKIETTLIYTELAGDSIKAHYHKYMSA